MTKLAPIDELARQCNAGIGYIAGTMVHPSNRTYTFTKSELEQLRQAIIKDFVSTLEPVHSQFFDVNNWYDYLNEKHKKNTIEAGYLHRDLYDLSEWSNK